MQRKGTEIRAQMTFIVKYKGINDNYVKLWLYDMEKYGILFLVWKNQGIF